MKRLETLRYHALALIERLIEAEDRLKAKVGASLGRFCLSCLSQGAALLITLLGYALFFVEILLWEPMKRVAKAVGKLRPFTFLGEWIRQLHIGWVLVLLVGVGVAIWLPMKVLDLYLFMHGHYISLVVAFIVGKFLFVFLCRCIYDLRSEELEATWLFKKARQFIGWLDEQWWYVKVKVPFLTAKGFIHAHARAAWLRIREPSLRLWAVCKRQGRRLRVRFLAIRDKRSLPRLGGAAA